MTSLPLVLFISAAMALWVAGRTCRRRPSPPGCVSFMWLMVAVAVWCATSGLHALAESLDIKIAWAKVQYLGIASVPPLWLLFAVQYADVGWLVKRYARAALWLVPILTVLAAATNQWHGAMWPDVRLEASGLAVYEHGWWFWVAAAYNYVLVLGGTGLLLDALRRSPLQFRGQWLTLIAAALVPLAGNALYLAGLTVPGFDLTPVAFTVSGLLFARSLSRDRLFDLVPVARDTVIESLSDAVIVLDSARRVLDMNAAARQLAGTPTSWVGRSVGSLIPLLREVRLDVVADSSTTLAADAPDTPRRYYDVRVIRVRGRNTAAAAWVVVMRDVSDELRADAERAALQLRVQEQQKRESLSVLAGGLAHDFNNLLTGIVGNADLLSLRIPPSSEMGSNVGAILLGAQRAADLVDKMLAYAGERHGSIERVDLNDLVGDMVELLRASAARHCTLRYEGQPAIVEADSTQVRQVAMNLIINAADAVAESTGEIAVATGVETLTGEQLADVECADDATPGGYAYLDVADNGPGMDGATLARICQPFFTTKPTGHGLGLAAVQGIVHGHRGALRVESRLGQGSRFRVWFPAAPALSPEGEARLQSIRSRTSTRVRTP
ncbi:MAG: PAS domain-containing protein [Acidobacteria bacterium]|nr:PAS domain-containing protein [Acidobacteriota bacterium]